VVFIVQLERVSLKSSTMGVSVDFPLIIHIMILCSLDLFSE